MRVDLKRARADAEALEEVTGRNVEEVPGEVPRTLGDRLLGEERAHRMRNRLKHLAQNLPEGKERVAALKLAEDVKALETAAEKLADQAYEAGRRDGREDV